MVPDPHSEKLLCSIRQAIDLLRMNPRTADVYFVWIRDYCRFHAPRHPAEMGAADIRQFMSHLSRTKKVSRSTFNQARSALKFLYLRVLKLPLEGFGKVREKKVLKPPPPSLSQAEVRNLLATLQGSSRLAASLVYYCGLRLLECLQLRLADVDLETCEIAVRDSSGEIERRVIFPESLLPMVQEQVSRVLFFFSMDCSAQNSSLAACPDADCDASTRMLWFFPQENCRNFKRFGREGRHHLNESSVSRHIKRARLAAGIVQAATPHTLRHSFALHMLAEGQDLKAVQKWLGHACEATTRMFVRVMGQE